MIMVDGAIFPKIELMEVALEAADVAMSALGCCINGSNMGGAFSEEVYDDEGFADCVEFDAVDINNFEVPEGVQAVPDITVDTGAGVSICSKAHFPHSVV